MKRFLVRRYCETKSLSKHNLANYEGLLQLICNPIKNRANGRKIRNSDLKKPESRKMKICTNIMNNLETLKGLTIEELQERNEFSAAEDSGCCSSKCDIEIGDVGL